MTLLEPMNQLVRDPIWGTPAARLFSTEEAKWRRASGYDSPRCGGQYIFHETAYLTCFSREEKCLLTTWLIEQRRNGIECPIITHETVEDTKQKSRMSVHDRADEILKYLQLETHELGKSIICSCPIPIGYPEQSVYSWQSFDERAPREIREVHNSLEGCEQRKVAVLL